MLTVTEKAAEALSDALQAADSDDSHVLRLASSGEGLGLALDEERDGDQVVVHEERKVLVIEAEVAQALTGAVVDAVDTPEGRRLVLQSPDGSR
jgi:Fe-S cluster assembly iron-binding protein IscA